MIYKFTLEQTYSCKTNIKGINFRSKWFMITENGTMIVKRGYSWDGCSPKFTFLDLLFGTPDGMTIMMEDKTYKPITYFASLVHDALYQYKGEHGVTRKEADQLFYEMLKDKKFIWARIYYIAVRIFGGFYGKWKNKKES